jgi:hypothetical protein
VTPGLIRLWFRPAGQSRGDKGDVDHSFRHGEAVAQTLRHRLADLRAASSPLDVPVGNPQPMDENCERMALNLRDGFRLLLAPNHVKNPRDANNRVDWKKVRRVKIMEMLK